MKAFISYSTTDKKVAGQVKSILEGVRVDAFLAHEDISVSQEWKDEIVQQLANCNVVVPILSAAFKKSEWGPQEIGFAYARQDVLFIPLSVDGTMPFGLISHVQGKRIPKAGLDEELLIDPIIRRFPHDLIPRLIERLSGANSFRGAEALMLPLVARFDVFNDDEIEAFATASIENGQIWDATDCRKEYLPKFLKMHHSRLNAGKRDALEYQLKNGTWYHLRNRDKKAATENTTGAEDHDLARSDYSLGFGDTN